MKVDGHRPRELDVRTFAKILEALSNPNRLTLLRQLVFPKPIRDVRLPAAPRRPNEREGRPASRQAVREHLLRLLEVGVVVKAAPRRVSGRKGWREEYLVSPQRIFAIAEEFRKLCFLRPTQALEDPTQPAVGIEGVSGSTGPRLIVVHGLMEGRSFPLSGRGPWIIGRRRDSQVPFEFDPYVSASNSLVRRKDEGFSVEDVPTSRNGTLWNWRRLAPEEQRILQDGDVIGIGRCLLLYRST